MKIGIIGKRDTEQVYSVVSKLTEWLKNKKIEFWVDEELAQKIGVNMSFKRNDLPKEVELVIVFGGDGTFLSASHQVNKHNIPLLGFNLGGLGFLTEFTVSEIFPIMEKIIEGNYEVEEREMMSASVFKSGKKSEEYQILNELVINNGPISRIIDLAIFIDDKKITTFKADGIIFATPTGSTAYSLSAGGPIAYPTLPVILITPICPHILTNRPLVVSNNMEIKVRVLTGDQNVYLTLDGQKTVTLDMKDEIVLKKSLSKVKLIKSPFRDYFSILKTKLMWGERYGSINE